MLDFVSSLLRFVLKVALGLMAAVFALSLLAAALMVLAFGLLKALITGKKPAPAMVFSRFRKYAPQDIWSSKVKPSGDVVDVEMRELREGGEMLDDPQARPAAAALATRRTVPLSDATDVKDKTSARSGDSAS
ncbi:MAG: hypothetical protein H7224_02625 [Polaromonas sp.]|nr:hypothetical protein [Polaromonas sp.]